MPSSSTCGSASPDWRCAAARLYAGACYPAPTTCSAARLLGGLAAGVGNNSELERAMQYVRAEHDLVVSRVGLGCMRLSDEPRDDASARQILLKARDLGVNLFDTAHRYGGGHNEELIGSVFASNPGSQVIATKAGFVGTSTDPRPVDARPDSLQASCDASLQRLGLEVIDLFYLHRVDPQVPIEESVGAMAELVSAGKVRYLGLCEVRPDTIRRSNRVHSISAVQSEYSLWSRDVEDGVLAACAEVGAILVAYSPLGMGFLAGGVRDAEEAPNRRLAKNPRVADEANLARNVALVEELGVLAGVIGCTSAELAIAWLLDREYPVVPIPGTRRSAHLRSLVRAEALSLDQATKRHLDALFAPGRVAGRRKHAPGMALVDR